MATPARFATPPVLKALRQVLLADAGLVARLGARVFAEAAVPATAPTSGEYLTLGPFTEVPRNTMGSGAKWGSELTAPIKVVSYSTDVAPAYALITQIIARLDGQMLDVDGYRTAWVQLEMVQDPYTELVAGVEVRHFPILFRVHVHES
jgi:hypothetical protein